MERNGLHSLRKRAWSNRLWGWQFEENRDCFCWNTWKFQVAWM